MQDAKYKGTHRVDNWMKILVRLKNYRNSGIREDKLDIQKVLVEQQDT